MTPRVWLAGFDEAEQVAALLCAFRDHEGASWPSDNSFLASVERLLEDPSTEYLLGAPHDDAPPAGVCQLRFRRSVWTASDDCWLEDLFVAAQARGVGLGRALLQAAFERAAERGCRRVELDVREDNEEALALYRSAGFDDKPPGGRTVFLQHWLRERG